MSSSRVSYGGRRHCCLTDSPPAGVVRSAAIWEGNGQQASVISQHSVRHVHSISILCSHLACVKSAAGQLQPQDRLVKSDNKLQHHGSRHDTTTLLHLMTDNKTWQRCHCYLNHPLQLTLAMTASLPVTRNHCCQHMPTLAMTVYLFRNHWEWEREIY